MKKDAKISTFNKYRYELTRVWNVNMPKLLICMLNPSMADDKTNDHTIKKVIKFAEKENYGSILVINLLAYISTDPKKIADEKEPIGPKNDAYIHKSLNECDGIWIAWGENAKKYKRRVNEVMTILKKKDIDIFCLGKTIDGHPRHPLRLSYKTPLEIYYSTTSI